jgi:hypothetical protein
MLSVFWFNWVSLLFDTAPYVILWLLFEMFLYCRLPHYYPLALKIKIKMSARYTFGKLWDKSWYWQLIGISVFAALALVLPDNIKEMAGLVFDANYHPSWLSIISLAFLAILTLARLLKRAFPNGGGGCDDGNCSIK